MDPFKDNSHPACWTTCLSRQSSVMGLLHTIKQRHKSAPSPGSESGKKRVHFCDEESMSRIDEKAAKIRKINEPFKSAVYSNTTTIQQGVAHHQGVYTPSKPRELLGILKHPGGRSSCHRRNWKDSLVLLLNNQEPRVP